MRNLKRVLSLALATIMLLGMMIVGASAVDVSGFKDADSIVNTEAAAITVGLEIFKGANGNFMPEKPVTRAEMATIIVKLLYGSNYNADSFKGITRFDDTRAFEGGWAEGYINLCAQLGIVSGKGNNKFAPGDTVTTAEASLMLMKALGYYDAKSTLNEYGDSWELASMTRADQLGLRGNVVMQAGQALSRDNVSLLVFNTLFAQRVSFNVDRNVYVKANDFSVAVNNGTEDPDNTLAQNTFGMYVVEGTVTANGITTEALAGKDGDPGFTTVVFDEVKDLDHDKRLDYKDYDFMFDTGLGMIGHKADVYYRLNRGTPEVFTIVDKATLVDVIRYDKDSTTRLATAANDLGFRRNTILNIKPEDYKVNYDLTAKAGTVYGADVKDDIDDKYLLLISNSGNYAVDEIIVLDQDLSQIKTINRAGDITLTYSGSSRKNVATYDAAVSDYVIVTNIGKQNARYALEPATVIGGTITKLTGVTGHRTLITASGVDYKQSPVVFTNSWTKDVIGYQQVRDQGATTLILDEYENLIAVAGEPEVTDYVYVAQFGSQHDNTSDKLNTSFGLTADVYFSDGTHKVMFVNDEASSFYPGKFTTPGNNVASAIDTTTKFDTGLSTGDTAKALNGTIADGSDNDSVHYTWSKTAYDTAVTGAAAGTDEAKAKAQNDGFNFTTGALGIYTYSISNDRITLTAIMYDETGDGTTQRTSATALPVVTKNSFRTGDRFIAGHATVVVPGATAVANDNVLSQFELGVNRAGSKHLRQTNGTVYFYINGNYGKPGFTVNVYDDVNDIKSFDVGADLTKPWVVQLFSEAVEGSVPYRTVSAALIDNVVDQLPDDVYYYNRGLNGNYTVTDKADGGALLTYYAYDKDGLPVEISFDKTSRSAAVSSANPLPTGYYTKGGSNLVGYAILSNASFADSNITQGTAGAEWTYVQEVVGTAKSNYASRQPDSATKGTMYVVNARLSYETYLNGNTNFFDNVTGIASLVQDGTVIVDACDSGLESVSDIVAAFDDNSDPGKECKITVSYDYSLATLKTGVLYITSYTPASSTGTNTRPTASRVGAGTNTKVYAGTDVITKDLLKSMGPGGHILTQDIGALETSLGALMSQATGNQQKTNEMLFIIFDYVGGSKKVTIEIRSTAGGPAVYHEEWSGQAGAARVITTVQVIPDCNGKIWNGAVSGTRFGSLVGATDGDASGATSKLLAAGEYIWEVTIAGEKDKITGTFTIN